MSEDRKTFWIVYDGDCPFCARYVRMLRLRDALGNIQLIDARSGHEMAHRVIAAGLDLNDGMALIDGDKIYHGDECINRLALMSTPSGVFNRINALIFRSETASRLLYPILRSGRNTVLMLLGRSKIDLEKASDAS